MGSLKAPSPGPVDHAMRGPAVLTRNGSDAFVLPSVDAYSHLRARTPRPPAIDAQSDLDS